MRTPHERSPQGPRSPSAGSRQARRAGVDLTGGVLTGMISLLVFGAVTAQVVGRGALTRFDVTLMLDLHQHSTAQVIQLLRAVTLLGAPVVIAIIGACVGVVLLVHRQWALLVSWTVALGGAGVLNELLKAAVHRPRPPYATPYLHHLSFSFPSGHAMGSMVGYGMLAYLLLLRSRRRAVRAAVVVVAAVFILGIGFSRLYLGVHYFSDVVGGYAAGGVWLSVCATGADLARRRPTA